MTRQLLSVYGLKWNPFTPDIPNDALWETPEAARFCWRVEQQIRNGGFALVTGESGTGKSITLRLLARHLQTMPDVVAGVLSRPQSSTADFYREMGDIFGVVLKVHYRWSSFKDLRAKWEDHLAATLWRPVLLIDEAQEMQPEVLSELRLLSSTQLDSRSILTVVLSGDNRLLDLLRLPPLIPLGTRIGPRLALDYATPQQLSELLTHLLSAAGNPRLMTPPLIATLCEHAAGNYRVLCRMSAELLAEGLRREASQLDEKLYMDLFSPSSRSRSRTDARKIAG
jgi:type II secretory pathway predicted ATPase ExeA